MIDTSSHVPPRLGALLSALLLVSGCGYGTLTKWEPESENNANDGPRAPAVEGTQDDSPAESCIDLGGPAAGDAPARLLTTYEYANTVRDLYGYDGDAPEDFPAENQVDGFENNAYAHSASKLLIRKYMKAAEEISKHATRNGVDELLPCDPSTAGEIACGEQFIRRELRRAFRRPPTEDEVANFVDLLEKGRSSWSYEEGIRLVLQGMLQSPQFLYRLKLVDPPNEGPAVRLDGYEIATRLSYMFWATAPDAKLIEAAEQDRLRTADQIERQARRMLDDPRAKNAVYQFHRQWLNLDGFDSVTKDSTRFPEFEAGMSDDWRESMREYVLDAYLSEDGDVERLLTSRKVFLSDELAPVYGFSPGGSGTEAYEADENRRAGLLTQPSLMALLSNRNQSSPIRRGVWVRERLLCEHLQPPPPDLMTDPPDPDPSASTRKRFRQHTENEACAQCHQKIDPIGFGFMHYDGMGRWRSEDNGSPVDASGRLAQTGESAIEGEFDGAVELANRLADSRSVRRCIAKRWFTYAMGRPPTKSEKCALRRVQQAFDEADGDFEEMLVSIATSEAFRYRTVDENGETP